MTYDPTYSEEITQELAVNRFTKGLREPTTSQTVRMARLKKIYQAVAYFLQFKIAKQISRNRGRIIRRVNVVQNYRKINEGIFMRLMRELQEV